MSFSNDIERFTKKVDDTHNKIFRGTALSLFSAVVRSTPVGNAKLWKTKYPPKNYTGGRLRGNWQAQIGTPASGEVEKGDKNGGGTISKINSVISKLRNGQSIFLVNNLPYAEKVENGNYSTQAPKGMMKVNVAKFKRIIKAQARKAKK